MLRDIEGLSTSETGQGLGLGDEAVKTRLHRARSMMRKALSARIGGRMPMPSLFMPLNAIASSPRWWSASTEGEAGGSAASAQQQLQLTACLLGGWPRSIAAVSWGVTMKTNLKARWLLVVLAVVGCPLVAAAQSYPITVVASAEASGASGALTGTLTIHVEQLMHDLDFKKAADALKYGGYLKVVPVLRQLPQIGYVKIGDRQTPIKYARERTEKPRLVLATDHPVYFVGGGSPGAKPTAGYELAVIQLDLDAQGNGTGTMAAAARVKPAPDGSVILDDYASAPVKLTIKPAK